MNSDHDRSTPLVTAMRHARSLFADSSLFRVILRLWLSTPALRAMTGCRDLRRQLIKELTFAQDSPQEGDGFELPVREHRAMAPSHGFAAVYNREAALRGAPASHGETAFRGWNPCEHPQANLVLGVRN